MKKVMIYISSLNMGGAERVAYTLANQFAKNMQTTILTDTIGSNEFGGTTEFKRVNLNYKVASNKLLRALNRFLYFFQIRKACKSINPDLIISFSIECGLRIQTALIGTTYNKIIAVRSNPAVDYKSEKDIKKISNRILKNQGFVFQTAMQRDYFEDEIREKSCIILNPINDDFMSESNHQPTKKEVITVGRLTNSKDHFTLLKAYDILAGKYPDYSFIIYGDGELMQPLKELRETLIHKNQITLYGATSETRKMMQQAAVFVLSSSNEGMPNSLMEAMAMELPVVSTDCPCGGPAELIQNGKNGFLVPVGDFEKIAKSVEDYLSSPALMQMMGKEAGTIRERCNKETITKQWEDYINSVLCP